MKKFMVLHTLIGLVWITTIGQTLVTETTGLYKSASFDSKKIATVDKGKGVVLIGNSGEFYKVKVKYKEGFIHESFLSNYEADVKSIGFLDGYKYIFIPPLKSMSGVEDYWGISRLIQQRLKSVGLKVLTTNIPMPLKAVNNSCLVLNCTIDYSGSSLTTTRVSITIYNCNEKVVAIGKGSSGSTFSSQKAYTDATNSAVSGLGLVKYNFDPDKTPQFNNPIVEVVDITESEIRQYLSKGNIDLVEGIYKTYESMVAYDFAIIRDGYNYKCILLKDPESKYWRQGEVKAYFEATSVPEYYSVKWYDGKKKPFDTFAAIEGGAILSIEPDNSIDKGMLAKFIKVFPSATGRTQPNSTGTIRSGSGFVISEQGLIATNAHVIESGKSFEVIFTTNLGSVAFDASVIAKDNANDVAILKIQDEKFTKFRPIPYAIVETGKMGDKVFTIGFPLNNVMGENIKATDGIISSNSGIADDIRYYQITVPLQPGNSGGPLFNGDGDLVGITTARLNERAVGTSVQNVNYAIKSTFLLSILKLIPIEVDLKFQSLLKGQEMSVQIEYLKEFVCIVKSRD